MSFINENFKTNHIVESQIISRELLNMKMEPKNGIKMADFTEKMDQLKFGQMDLKNGGWMGNLFMQLSGVILIKIK